MHSLGIVLSVQFSVLWESEVAGEEAFDWDREKTIYEVTLLGQASPILAAYLTAHPQRSEPFGASWDWCVRDPNMPHPLSRTRRMKE
jgi:hypothetical protein